MSVNININDGPKQITNSWLGSFMFPKRHTLNKISYQEAPCSPNKLQPFMDSRAALAKPMELA